MPPCPCLRGQAGGVAGAAAGRRAAITAVAGGARATVVLVACWPDQHTGARGDSVPCDVPGSPGKRWNGAGLQLQGRLLVDPEQAGSSLGAGGDVFSSLKFDFHDLFLLLAATPSTGSGCAFPAKELN